MRTLLVSVNLQYHYIGTSPRRDVLWRLRESVYAANGAFLALSESSFLVMDDRPVEWWLAKVTGVFDADRRRGDLPYITILEISAPKDAQSSTSWHLEWLHLHFPELNTGADQVSKETT